MRGFLIALGRAARRTLSLVGQVARLNVLLALALLSPRRLNFRLILRLTASQARFTGLEAVPLVGACAVLVGGLAVVQTFGLLAGLADATIGKLLVGIIVREFGPLLVAVVLIGRSGTAIATEVGAMSLSGELDALKAFRIGELDFIVLPRALGMILATFSLIVFFDAAGILGGFGAASLLKDVSLSGLRELLLYSLTNADLAVTAVKAVVFGHAVAVLACVYGLRVRGSSTELPKAVTRAVVASMGVVLALDTAITAAFYML